MIRAAILSMAAVVLTFGAAQAEPMKCSTENQTCTASCGTQRDIAAARQCFTLCSQRVASCRQNGCWDNGQKVYCGLLRQ